MSNFIQLSNFSFCSRCFVPKPVIKDDNHFIIVFNGNERGINLYNTTTDKITKIKEFDDEAFNFQFQFIDTKTNNLYLFNGWAEHDCVVYNFNTKEMKTLSTEIETVGCFPRILYHPKTDQVICCESGQHIYTLNKNELTSYRVEHYFGIDSFSIPLKIRNEIKICAGSDNYIITSVNASKLSDLNDCKWISSKLKMPHTVSRHNYFDAVAVGDMAIIFYFGYNENESKFLNEIWCIDFLHQISYKSSETIPFKHPNPKKKNMWYSIKLNNDDDIHLMQFITGKHFKINLYKLIPTKIMKKYSKYHNKLVFGYCRKNSLTIPVCLMTLIYNYIPYFV